MMQTPLIPPSMTVCDCTVPPHVDNCPDCCGFGLVRGIGDFHVGYRPRLASEAAVSSGREMADVCPTCLTGVSIEEYGTMRLRQQKPGGGPP